MSKDRVLAPVCLATPEPGDFCCIPVSGGFGTGIEAGQFLAELLQGQPAYLRAYDHAEVYTGEPDEAGPHGYTYSAYPDNGSADGRTGKRPLPCPPAQVPGSIWSSGIIELTQAQRDAIIAWCEAHPDVAYSWPDYGAIAAHALHVPAPGLKAYISGTASMICSQYTDSAYADSGVHLFDDKRWCGFVTPGDLAGLLMSKAHIPEPRTA